MNLSTKELANAIRFLSIDAVEKAQSGHPGMPLGMADIATVLWMKFLQHSPNNPHWFNRDRFVLSNGHGSMLLYSLLHLAGYKLSIDDLKAFRQLHSKTPGHPEYAHTPGVETTTGPLGQGLANAVGFAIAEKNLAANFNRPDFDLVNHYTYTFIGDGCLMEGISHEAASLAGTLQLGKLIVFYDDNGISIDGKVEGWFSDNNKERFAAYHWQVIGPIDGHNPKEIEAAIYKAQEEKIKPSLIICKTEIGFGSPLANSEKAHGSPLGAQAIEAVRANFNWSHAPFVIPEEYYQAWSNKEKGQAIEDRWLGLCAQYEKKYPEAYHDFLRRINGCLPDNWQEFAVNFIKACQTNNKTLATRKSSQLCIEQFAAVLPEMLGGSADLTGSNNTNWSGTKAIKGDDFSGNYLNYGVREFAMAAIMNGLALHGGFIPYGGTFLVFADYARNAIRLSALMNQRVIYVLTHDSIGLGEDGPTHQPIEHATMLRLTPNLDVWRPADLVETAVAWQQALDKHHGPSALLLSRQNLKGLDHSDQSIDLIKKGGYILCDSSKEPELILMATGSEVELATEVHLKLKEKGIAVRLVSMPNSERFLKEELAYQEQVLPKKISKRIAIEAGATNYWYRFTGLDGLVFGIDSFGVSAKAEEAYAHFGLTVDNIVSSALKLLND